MGLDDDTRSKPGHEIQAPCLTRKELQLFNRIQVICTCAALAQHSPNKASPPCFVLPSQHNHRTPPFRIGPNELFPFRFRFAWFRSWFSSSSMKPATRGPTFSPCQMSDRLSLLDVTVSRCRCKKEEVHTESPDLIGGGHRFRWGRSCEEYLLPRHVVNRRTWTTDSRSLSTSVDCLSSATSGVEQKTRLSRKYKYFQQHN